MYVTPTEGVAAGGKAPIRGKVRILEDRPAIVHEIKLARSLVANPKAGDTRRAREGVTPTIISEDSASLANLIREIIRNELGKGELSHTRTYQDDGTNRENSSTVTKSKTIKNKVA